MHTKLLIISFLQKLIIFLLPNFWRIREEISKSRILWPIAWVGIIKRFIWFFKIMPLGVSSFFQMVPQWKEVSIGMDSLLPMITNSFKNSIIQKLENIFSFFVLTLWSWNLFSFLEISAKFIMTKGVQNKSIHFTQMLPSKQSLHF